MMCMWIRLIFQDPRCHIGAKNRQSVTVPSQDFSNLISILYFFALNLCQTDSKANLTTRILSSRPISQETLRKCERLTRDFTFICNQVAGFSWCLTKVQHSMATYLLLFTTTRQELPFSKYNYCVPNFAYVEKDVRTERL